MLTKIREKLAVVSRQAAAEGIVLLENKHGVLPLQTGQTISLFGRCQINTYRSGTGSGGAVNVPYAVNALAGLRANPRVTVNEQLADIYQQWIAQHPFDDGGGGWAAEPWFQQEMPVTKQLVAQAAAQSDKAVVFIGRTAGEDKDNADAPGSYRLTELEEQMLITVSEHFQQVIVVFNCTNIMDMSWLNTLPGNESIKAVLYNWAAGMEGGHALADVLCGDVSPSGRLADTVVYKLEDHPASAHFGGKDHNCYVEDIYVGYRYFETFKPQAVQYEFGAGLSYSQFKREFIGHSITGSGAEQVIHFDFSLQNIGTEYVSKEVAQLYCQAPQGKLGKPLRVLVGFVKSKALKPGELQALRISVALKSLSSYDDSGITGKRDCYLLEPGSYQFYLGGSVRNAQAIPVSYQLSSLLVTEQLSEALAPNHGFSRLHPGKLLATGCYQETYVPVPQRTVAIKQRMATNMPTAIAQTGDQGFKLEHVKAGNITLSAFIGQLSPAELATLIRGEGMCSAKVSPGTAAAFGGVSERLFHFGIPVVACVDGPSGIRMDSGHQATQVAIGTLLSCTWNSELNGQLFYLIGQEMGHYQIDNLLGPGVNIHRYPLNGRNFEYFSEDPLLTGVMAAAQTRALKKAGVSATLKHFVANDQETARYDADSIVSQRALREIHLKGFEMAVKQGDASSIMTSYNPINGYWGASNYDLNSTILRGEWHYQGLVMTDWWAQMNDPVTGGEANKYSTSYMLRAQNDLYMVVENDGAERNAMNDDTLAALQQGSLSLAELQRSAANICRFIMATPAMERPLIPFDPIKTVRPLAINAGVQAMPGEQAIEFNTNENKVVLVDIVKPGVYQVSAEVSYDRHSLAQSTCSLSLNGTFCMSLAVNGSEGECVTVQGLKVRLDKGQYQLAVNFVKPGMVVHSLSFT